MNTHRYFWLAGVWVVMLGASSSLCRTNPAVEPQSGIARQYFIDIRSPAYAGGARCNGQVSEDSLVEAGSRLLLTPRNRFVQDDVGDDIAVKGAGERGETLITKIAAYNSPRSITLDAAAARTVRFAVVHWGSDDSAAIQSALNYWKKGGTIISPGGETCIFTKPLTVTFTPGHWNNAKVINLNGGVWFGMINGDHDLRFETKGLGEITAYNFKMENGIIEDAGGATFAVLDFDGGHGSDHYLAEIEGGAGLKVISDGAAHGIHLQSVFQSRFFGVTAENDRGQVERAFDWYIQRASPGDQLTGDIALFGCEGINGDVAVYDDASEVKIFGGTYFQTLHQLFYGSGVSGVVISGAHFENSWVGNVATAGVRPDVECDGNCDIRGNFDYSAGGKSGSRTYFAKLFVSGPDNESTLGYTTMSGETPFRQAFVQTGSGWTSPTSGHITLIGMGLSQITDASGICMPLGYCSNLTVIGSDGVISTRQITTDAVVMGSIPSSRVIVTPACSSGNFRDVKADLELYSVDQMQILTVVVDDRANGNCEGAILVPLPFETGAYNSTLACNAAPSGEAGIGAIADGSHVIKIVKYDGASLASEGSTIVCSGATRAK